MTLLPKPGFPLFSSVQSWLVENQVEVIEITIEQGRLDEVFRRLTTHNSQ